MKLREAAGCVEAKERQGPLPNSSFLFFFFLYALATQGSLRTKKKKKSLLSNKIKVGFDLE
jgi:hypothetical protein